MLSGGGIFTVDSSLPDESNDGRIKVNGATKWWRQRAESTALPRQTERVAVRRCDSDCEISRVDSTSSDDQSGRRHKIIGGLWWQQWKKRGTA